MTNVLLLRALKSTSTKDPYVQTLEVGGFSATCINALSFKFINSDKLLNCLKEPEKFGGFIFTSPRTVEAIQRLRTDDSNLLAPWLSKHCYVVGKGTSKVAHTLGLSPEGEESGTGEKLLEYICSGSYSQTQPLLIPCGNLSGDDVLNTLQAKGIQCKSLVVYETCSDENIDGNIKKYIENNGVPDAVVFFSPSGVNASIHSLQSNIDDLKAIKLIAIGPTTFRAMTDSGLSVFNTASSPDPEGVLNALSKY